MYVNYDLPQVVVALADERGDLAGMRRDFDTMNDVLAATYPEVLRDLGGVSHWVNFVASVGGGRIFNFSLVAARRQAWVAATRLHALDAAGRAEYVTELDELVRVLAYCWRIPDFRRRCWCAPAASSRSATRGRSPPHSSAISGDLRKQCGPGRDRTFDRGIMSPAEEGWSEGFDGYDLL